MEKEKFINEVSKINETTEDEFRAKYNSPELMWEYLKSKRVVGQLEMFVTDSLPENNEIIKWANEAELSRGHEHLNMTTSQKTAYIQGRCDGARWMKNLSKEKYQ